MGAGLMKTTTEMQLVPITKLVPYVNNARTHSPEQINKLRSSLREFGFINPVIIDRDYGVIAGHGRILAAKEEGIAEVPCVFADHLTEAQKKAYIIADNRMAMDAGWDEELLRVEIESLQAADFDPLLTGFDEKELSRLLTTALKPKRIILMWMPSCKSLPSRSPATSGRWDGIGWSAVTAQRKKPTLPLWTVARQTSSLPTHPTM